MIARAVLALALLAYAGQVTAQEARTPAEAVDNFHKALTRNDTAAALSMLTRELVVFEFGLIDPSLAQYAFKHLPLDMDAAAATTWTVDTRRAGGLGDQFWVLTTYRVTGYDKLGTPIDNTTLETVILQRTGGVFRIVHFHWSSVPKV